MGLASVYVVEQQCRHSPIPRIRGIDVYAQYKKKKKKKAHLVDWSFGIGVPGYRGIEHPIIEYGGIPVQWLSCNPNEHNVSVRVRDLGHLVNLCGALPWDACVCWLAFADSLRLPQPAERTIRSEVRPRANFEVLSELSS